MKDIPHGTANGYTNYGCRCEECRIAWNAYYKEYVKGTCPGCGGVLSNRYYYKLCDACQRATIPPSVHGTEAYYLSRKCRCEECRAASAAARRRRRQRVSA